MDLDQAVSALLTFEGVVDLAPEEGSEFPPIAWGDHFFYYSPDGSVPQNRQPFATIVTKDYPDDAQSQLDPDGRWRLNVHVGRASLRELVGEVNGGVDGARDYSETDVILPHPVYGPLGWIAVVNPGPRTESVVLELLAAAHRDDLRRVERRA